MGNMKNPILTPLFLAIFFLTIFSLSKALISSTSGEFSLQPETIYLNWTNCYTSNLTLNSTFNISIVFENSSLLFANYSQSQGINLILKNNTGDFSNITTINTSESNYTNFTLILNTSLAMPGRYEAVFFVKNVTNSSENVSIKVIADVPIEINHSTGIGIFNGSLPENATYHSFYFNCSAVENVTSISVHVDDKSLNIFLLADGKLVAKSIEDEGIASHSFVNSSATYEIRIYGSGINYTGSVTLLTLNSSLNEIDFGTQNVTNKTITKTFNLTNEGGIPIYDVSQDVELYYVKKFEGNGSKNFTVFLPNSSIIGRIKVRLVWEGEGTYNISVYNPLGELVGSSSQKYVGAEISKVEKEEFLKIDNVAKAGWWRIEVVNTTGHPDYNLIIQAFLNESKWISTNFSNYVNKTFDVLGKENSTKTVEVNLTIPNDAISGEYEGFLSYIAVNGGEVKIPIKLNIITPVLVLNDSMEDLDVIIKENFGVDLTKTIYLNISNLGNQNLSLTFPNSSHRLNCVSGCNNSYFALLNFNTTNEIEAGNSSLIQINVTFNKSMPKNSFYAGWILIDSTNEDSNLTSHPYPFFNVSIKLNLTDWLNLTIVEIKSVDYGNETINTSSKASWFNATFSLKYVNGTEIFPQSELFNLSDPNKLKLRLYEPTASHLIVLTNFSNISNSTHWILNISLPPNLPGGNYFIRINLTSNNLTSNPSDVYKGENSDDKILIIDDVGLWMNLTSYPSTLQTGESGIVNVSIKNLGPRNASKAQIIFEKCGLISNVTFFNSSCPLIENTADKFNFTLPGYNYTGCYVAWRITAGNTTGSCTFWIKGTYGLWFGNLSSSITITSPTTTTTTTIPNITTTTTIPAVTTTTTTTIPAVTTLTNESFKIPFITPENPAILNITRIDVFKVFKITIFVNKNVSNVQITLKEATKPPEVDPPITEEKGSVFKYFEISSLNLQESDVVGINIDFQVEKSWLNQNNVNPATISLYRYHNNSWEKLPTRKTDETANYFFYRSLSPGFSLFAIAGEKSKTFPVWLILVVVGVVVGVLVFLFWPVEEKPKIEKKEGGRKEWEELKKKWEELKKKIK
ncbi:MAG: PGF-pre-PGF domain-containing protein [Candidatus Aenigmatarchaeota archaeon]